LEKGSLRTWRRAEAAKDFSIFIRRNALKSLDSEKLMKGNESYFPFISFHWLSFVFGRSSRTVAARVGRSRA
jgi:hypothetical protein